MNALCWNCQGLGDSRVVQALLELIQHHHPLVVFLCETKCSDVAMVQKQRSLGFDKSFSVSSNGRSGGLLVLWMDEVVIDVISSLANHIDMECHLGGSEVRWHLMGFYGHLVTVNRHLYWSLLADLGQRSSLPWICLGDFNEVLSVDEQLGGNQLKESQMDGFREAVHACQLIDMGFVVNSYTWTDNREHEEESCEGIISLAWNKSVSGFQVCEKIRFTRCALLAWQREVFGFTKAEIAKVSRAGIQSTVIGYFQNIFHSCGVLDNAVQEVIAACSQRVTPEMNAELLKPYSEEEVCVALFQMHTSKAPGPDGMLTLFFQKF
ncbi:hypothetical protein FF1_038662 [Malus domestica]